MTGMNGQYVVRGNNAECYVKIGDKRYNFAQAISLEASVDIDKAESTSIGKTAKFSFSTTWKGTGSMTFHYNTSIVREILEKFKDDGTETFFTIEVKNKSNNSELGGQTVCLNECSIDGGILAKFDSDAEYLDEEVSFTFNDFTVSEKFKDLDFMEAKA